MKRFGGISRKDAAGDLAYGKALKEGVVKRIKRDGGIKNVGRGTDRDAAALIGSGQFDIGRERQLSLQHFLQLAAETGKEHRISFYDT